MLHTPAFPLLVPTEGEPYEIRPNNGTNFTLEELYAHLNCDTIQIVKSEASGKIGAARRPYILITDEEGKLKARRPNPQATEWFSSPVDIIVGNVILCHADYLQ